MKCCNVSCECKHGTTWNGLLKWKRWGLFESDDVVRFVHHPEPCTRCCLKLVERSETIKILKRTRKARHIVACWSFFTENYNHNTNRSIHDWLIYATKTDRKQTNSVVSSPRILVKSEPHLSFFEGQHLQCLTQSPERALFLPMSTKWLFRKRPCTSWAKTGRVLSRCLCLRV